MSRPHRLGAILTVILVLAWSRTAAAEPVKPCSPSDPCHLRMREDTTLTKDDGTQYRLPPGHFYDQPTWDTLELEFKRLQTQETRLEAENKSLRKSMDETWKPGWLTIFSALVIGAAGGVGGYYWYTHR